MRKKIKKHKKVFATSLLIALISIFSIIYSAGFHYLSDKIINTQIVDTNIFLKNRNQAVRFFSQNASLPEKLTININTPTGSQSFEVFTKDINARIDYAKTVEKAYLNTKFKHLWQSNEINPVINYDVNLLSEQLSLIAGQLFIPPVYPDITINGSEVKISKGNIGYEIDVLTLEKNVVQRLVSLSDQDINISMQTVGQVLGDSDEALIKDNSLKLENKSLDIIFENYRKTLGPNELVKIISGVSGQYAHPVNLLIAEISESIERSPQNPIFNEENGRVVEFSPAINGVEIIDSKFKQEIDNAIAELISENLDSIEIKVPTKQKKPELSTIDVNEYGIKELIGRGSSKFVGSIPNRVHNVALAAEKINGTLVEPGETFSFNKTIGDISVYTGFKQSYVIQGNQTVLGDGGGVCQVSTTLFRAALNSGLPIAERRAHSYRVGYYEQGSPIGLDATIYSPTVDLKITNDTPAHMLIQSYVDTSKMTLEFEIYGTDDGREVTLTTPVVTSVSPAPEDLYIDDPTKPTGYIEQIDYAAGGARVEYDYKVVRDGEVLQDKKFYSNYRPWQAKFIRGIGPTS